MKFDVVRPTLSQEMSQMSLRHCAVRRKIRKFLSRDSSKKVDVSHKKPNDFHDVSRFATLDTLFVENNKIYKKRGKLNNVRLKNGRLCSLEKVKTNLLKICRLSQNREN